MKKAFFSLSLLFLTALTAFPQDFTEWQNPNINSVNRLPMHSSFIAAESKRILLG